MKYANAYCEIIEEENSFTFVGPCVVTGKEQRVTVNAADLFRYRNGGYIQECFPYLSTGDREFLISGTSDEGWKILFGNDEEDENDY